MADYRLRFSSERAWTPPCRCCRCRRLSPPMLAAPNATRTIPCSGKWGLNYMKGRLRSHPDVARRHHADLLEPPIEAKISMKSELKRQKSP